MSDREESLDAEIRDYLERETRENIEAGMRPEQARQAALRKLGPVLRVKEDTRAAWGWAWLARLSQDLRYGARMLRQNPGFIPLAIGLGRLLRAGFPEGDADPAHSALLALALFAATVLAAYVPARRASRVDPTIALRDE